MLVNAEVDGEKLSHQDIASFFILLVVAGNETTRNSISWGLRYLTDHPDRRAIWMGDPNTVGPTAVEEIVRHQRLGFGGPGPHFCLGAHLARREISVMFGELFSRLPDIHATGAPDPLASSFIHGVKHLPASFTPV